MLERVKNIFSNVTKNLLFCSILVYLSFHLLNGQNGIISYIKQSNQLEKVNAELIEIESHREKIKNKVGRLYSHSLDADLLDEQYRRSTGKIKDSEVIHYY